MTARRAWPLVRTDARNLIALAGIQGGNALVPLLIVPLALARIGPTEYAVVATTEAVMALVLAAVLFSFEVDGVARLAALPDRTDRAALGALLSEILAARTLMFLLAAPAVLLIYWLVGGGGLAVLAAWLLVPLGSILHSYWFYQGTEDNMPAAAITLACRIVTVIMAFMLLRGPDDGVWVPLSIGAPFVLAGLASVAYLVHHHRLRLGWPGLAAVLGALRRGKEIFGGNLAVTLYRDLNVLILGLAGAAAPAIAAYSLVEKWTKMIQAATRPLNQMFFPKVLRALGAGQHPGPDSARTILHHTLPQLLAIGALLVALALAGLAALRLWPQLGTVMDLPQLVLLAAIMLPVTVIGMANFMFGTAGLNYLGGHRYLMGAIVVTGLSNLAICYTLSVLFGAVGAAASFLGAEVLLLALIGWRYRASAPCSVSRNGPSI